MLFEAEMERVKLKGGVNSETDECQSQYKYSLAMEKVRFLYHFGEFFVGNNPRK